MYESTRSPHIQAASKQAILEGLAPDGGLYVLPELDQIQLDLEQILNQSYRENAKTILQALLDDFSKEELDACIEAAYHNTFAADEITPLVKVGNTYVLELFHGPTSAFKDIALTLLPQLMQKALQQSHQKALILTATSGDTGKAAMSGFQDVKDIAICVFYPYQKVSAIQQKQMSSQPGYNVGVAAVQGNFDDTQSEVKKLFLDTDLKEKAKEKKILLSSANSINIGRLIPQIVYYFEAYKDLVKDNVIQKGEKIIFVVPTGNFGDVLAGYYAYLLGLPIKKLVVASNANHILTDFLTTGIYDTNRDFLSTISPSMDILISSNLERLLYYMTGKDHAKVSGWMKDLKESGRFEVDKETLKKIQDLFACDWADDEKTKETIGEVYKESGYILDPHSAVAYTAAQKLEESEPIVVLSTASPYKFSKDVLDGLKAFDMDNLDINTNELDEWQALEKLDEINEQPVPKGLSELQEKPVLHQALLEKEQMKDYVLEKMEALL